MDRMTNWAETERTYRLTRQEKRGWAMELENKLLRKIPSDGDKVMERERKKKGRSGQVETVADDVAGLLDRLFE